MHLLSNISYALLIFTLLVNFASANVSGSDTTGEAAVPKTPAIDRIPLEPQQFTSEGHVLGFSSDSIYIVGADRALKVAFIDSNPVIPTAPPRSLLTVTTEEKSAAFSEMTYHNLWDGIDLRYDKGNGILRSTYTVKPGASVDDIALKYNVPVRIGKSGSVKIRFDSGEWIESPPIAWQVLDGRHEAVQVTFNSKTDNQLGFSVGNYNRELPLVIDPTLTWNTVLGTNGNDSATSIALDSNGNIIVGGSSSASWGIPLNPHPGSSGSAFVAKLNTSGGLVWHTFFGNTGGSSLAVDEDDNIYITGVSMESWGNPVDPYVVGCCGNTYVAKLNTNGALQWNTFFGNSGSTGLALDTNRNIIVTGSGSSSWGTPIIPHSGGGNDDMFVAKLNEFGVLQWNTFLGSSGRHDTTRSDRIAVNDSGDIFVTGNSRGSWGTPIRPYSEPDTVNSPDVFVAKINTNGALQWNTFLGGTNGSRSFDTDDGISLDGSGNVYVLGRSESSWGSPVNPHTGGTLAYNCFVAKLEPSGSLQWHSFYHWQGTQNYHNCIGESITVDGGGNIAFTGILQSDMISSSYFIYDIIVAELDNAGVLQNSVILGTPLVGGNSDYRYNFSRSMVKDSSGSIYLAGSANSDWDSNVNIGTAFPSSYYDILVAKVSGFSAVETRPIANAGPDQAVLTGATVTLDGSQSTDPNGDLLTYSWSFSSVPSGSAALLSDSSSVNPSFNVDVAGSYVVSLMVSDGTENSVPDTVSVSTLNVAPVANAGSDQAVLVGEIVTLDGSQSTDADGDLLTFNWSLTNMPPGSTAVLDDSTSVSPSFVVDVAGVYNLSLLVNDGTVDSQPDTINISTVNVAPTADAGADQAVYVGDLVTLNGSQSADPDGDTLNFLWNFTSLPVGSNAGLNDPTTANPTFTADQSGIYVVSLVVNDGTTDSTADTVSISTINVPPIADAGPDQAVFVGNSVSLDGNRSMDMDGDPLTYSWSFTSLPTGSTATLSDPSSVNPTFNVDLAGIYSLSLVVNDGVLNSSPDTISISTINVPPVADAGPYQSVLVGDTVTLDGSQSSDADGDSLSYSWSFTDRAPGSNALLSDATSPNPYFSVDVAGIYILSLVVNDGTVVSAPASVTISAVTVETAATNALQDVLTTLNGFDQSVFKNKRNLKALTNKVNTVIDAIEAGEIVRAIRKLEQDILKKTDGCAISSNPDNNDWIRDCSSQSIVYPQIVDIIDLLESL